MMANNTFHLLIFGGGQKGLKERVIRDTIKTNWAKKNNYVLYRIAYNENITRSLDKITKNAT